MSMTNISTPITEEQIVAYVDGELDAETAERVREAISESPALAASADEYRSVKAALAGAFAPVAEEPVPERLLETVANAATNILRWPLRTRDRTPGSETTGTKSAANLARWLMPLAATLLVGMLVGQFWLNSNSSPAGYFTAADGSLVAQAHLASALDNQSSGASTTTTTSKGETPAAAIALSYRAEDGSLCRVFNLRDTGAAPMAGVACRGNEVWRVTALAPVVSAGATIPGDYQPAGAVALPAAINAAIADTIDGDPLGADEEATARQNGWR